MVFPGVALLCWGCSKAFGRHLVSSRPEGVMHAPLHMLVVLLCSTYWAFSCSLDFAGSPPLSSPHVPWHPTSISDEGVNDGYLRWIIILFSIDFYSN